MYSIVRRRGEVGGKNWASKNLDIFILLMRPHIEGVELHMLQPFFLNFFYAVTVFLCYAWE